MTLGGKAAVTTLRSEPAALQPCSATPECELQTLGVEQGLLCTQLAGTQALKHLQLLRYMYCRTETNSYTSPATTI